MELQICQSNKEFKYLYESYLNQHPQLSQLLSVNIEPATDEPLNPDHIRGAVLEEEEIKLVFLNAMPYNLQLYSEKLSKEAIIILVDYLAKAKIYINGVQGNKEHSDYFIEAYTKRMNCKFKLRLAMDIMRLDRLIIPRLIGNYLPATTDDLETLINIEINFYHEVIHTQVLPKDIAIKAKKQIENKQIYKLTNSSNQIVSIAMASRKLYHGRAISLVYTYPEYRNLGYSSSLMYHLCLQLFDEGNEYVTLFVDKSNPISNRVYEKIGFYISESNYDYVMEG